MDTICVHLCPICVQCIRLQQPAPLQLLCHAGVTCKPPAPPGPMAVVLRLKDICRFDEAQTNAHAAYGDPHKTPVPHFNALFRCLFGLRELPDGADPHAVVDVLQAFVVWVRRSVRWFVLRTHKYLWAMRRRRLFLRQGIADRRKRLQEALDKWDARDAQMDREFEARRREEVMRNRGRKRDDATVVVLRRLGAGLRLTTRQRLAGGC